jgi:hypothetical protein
MEPVGNFRQLLVYYVFMFWSYHLFLQVPDGQASTSTAPEGASTIASQPTAAETSPSDTMLAHTVPPEDLNPWAGQPLSSYPAGTESAWAGWAAPAPSAAPAATAAAAAAPHQLAANPSIIEKFNPLVTMDPMDPESSFSSPGDACCDPWCTAYCRGAYSAVSEPPHHAALAAGPASSPNTTVVVNEVTMDCPGTAQVGNVVIHCQARPAPDHPPTHPRANVHLRPRGMGFVNL